MRNATPDRACPVDPPGGDRHGDREGTRIDEVPVGPWLQIPFNPSDSGVRKLTTECFWESPNIWIKGGDKDGNAIADKPTPVFARIWNRGTIRCFPTDVYFAFAAPALGIPLSAPKLFGKARTCVAPQILGPGTAVVRSDQDWIPPSGTTHSCLFVMCSCPILKEIPAHPWSVREDRRVAQRNVTVVSGEPGQKLAFALEMTNVFAAPAMVQVATQASWVTAGGVADALRFSPGGLDAAVAALDRAIEPAEQHLLARRASLILAGERAIRGTLLAAREVNAAVRLEHVETIGRARSGSSATPARDHNRLNQSAGFTGIDSAVLLNPLVHRRGTVAITVPRPPAGASHFVVRVAQLENQVITGGYTFVVDVGGGSVRHQETTIGRPTPRV